MQNGKKKALKMTEEPSAGKYLISKFICVVILLAFISAPVFGQEKQKISTNILAGRWAGDIRAEFKSLGRKGKLEADGQSTIKIFNLLISEYDEEYEGRAEFSGTNRFYDSRGRIGETWTLENNVEVINIYGHFLEGNRIYFSSENEVKVKRETFLGLFIEEFPAFSIGAFVQLVGTDGARFEVNEGNIFINDEVSHTELIAKITGQLYRIETLKKTFPKDIKPDEPIKTDKKTQLEITMPSKDVINVAQNTEAVIRSESLMEVVKGKIHAMIEKLKVRGKFEYNTPAASFTVRGTEFELNVEDDGTTTLIVLDGELEFSDINKKKIMLVSKNQQVVVKPGEFPPLPVQIDPDKILRWWK
ncbi:MAG: FecR family protein [Bacteroidia bacterium]|nr:FecR family protein [Bacteroidia bacterium]